MKKKCVDDSKTEQFRLLKYEDINGANRLFGGKLMAWIDEVAGVTARRHCETQVTTACIDNLQFKEPAFLGNMVVIIGRITYIGRSSMEVRVDSYVEDAQGFRRPINRQGFNTLTTILDILPQAFASSHLIRNTI